MYNDVLLDSLSTMVGSVVFPAHIVAIKVTDQDLLSLVTEIFRWG